MPPRATFVAPLSRIIPRRAGASCVGAPWPSGFWPRPKLLAQAEHELFQVEMNPTTKRRALEHAMRLVRAARALHQQERPKRTRRKHKVQSQEPLR